MAELKTRYMGLDLENPLVVSSSGITGSVDGVRRVADSGAGAVVLKSMFEELIITDSARLDEVLAESSHPEAYEYIRAKIGMRLGPKPYLELIEDVSTKISLPVIASVNCITPDWWVPYARQIESAGAAGLELNISHFPESNGEDPRDVEKRYVEIVHKVSDELTIPVAVKLGFYFTSLGNLMGQIVEAGAKALVLFNRYYSVDVDVDDKKIVHAMTFSSPEEMRIPLRWVGLLSDKLDCDFAAQTGIHDTESVVKMLMVGATAVQLCSVLYKRGLEHLDVLRTGLSTWLDEGGYTSVNDIRGLALKSDEGQESLLTRLQYVTALDEASTTYEYK